jgi:3-deoxy-D-manno-octulosonic acid kinase
MYHLVDIPITRYDSAARSSRVARVRADWADIIGKALLTGAGCLPAGTGGRGGLERFPYPGGEGIIRRYRRGGIMRHVLSEGFLFANRPLQEFELLCWMHDAGLPVPAPLGVVWERRGALIRGAIATHALNAVNLLDWLRDHEAASADVLRDCGALIRRMHDLGVWHADLQVANVLVADDGLYLIDFDKSRRLNKVRDAGRMRNLLRFRRSLEKHGVAADCFAAVCHGYGDVTQQPWLERAYAFKGRLSDVMRRG